MDKVKSVPALSRLAVSSKSRHLFKEYLNVLPQINFNLYPQYGEGVQGLTQDSFVELKEAMFDLCDIYEAD
ncbi:2775_t:CDS:2 [Ambispora gerdemannii]|uniref:2775_t:CDS:1 n=1 Tax=Ambispora gerdemannii TaxID=144530 RepID=A0A9N8VQQ4_9GLOM|nr:2775_t:CDS:2 [Ambispora gerdemannii]